ncbi:MAG: transposase [Armatimonadota bacterium]
MWVVLVFRLSVCRERQLIEQLQYNLLFRWFVVLGLDDQT